MKRRNSLQTHLLIDPTALAAACIISVLFAFGTQNYFLSAKRNLSDAKNQTIVCLKAPDNLSPQDRPTIWELANPKAFQETNKKNSHLFVTFHEHRDYKIRLQGFIYGLFQPSAWLPSIPITYRKLII